MDFYELPFPPPFLPPSPLHPSPLHSIEYWFRCMDSDGDGVLSLYELVFFYEEVLQRLQELNIDCLSVENTICQVLDMVNPRDQSKWCHYDVTMMSFTVSLLRLEMEGIWASVRIWLAFILECLGLVYQARPSLTLQKSERGLPDVISMHECWPIRSS